ncbi:uncharacterized protein [Clytia hemisphaerica]|uniref:MADF domain-containing protein n=1 Tax=Clytia hemisphaerica TaxID=252671 RepID=A0A7M5U0M3_9CNID|eukprot:TCONS_00072144-protein
MRSKRYDNELSEAVRQHPCLYDRSSPYFNHREYVAKCWEVVATTSHLPDAETARKAFENLRKRYNKVKGQYHVKHPLDAKERSELAKELAGYSFLTWLEPFIHRRRSRNVDEHFNATMVDREYPSNFLGGETVDGHHQTPSMYSELTSNDDDSIGEMDETSRDGTFPTLETYKDHYQSTLADAEETKPDLTSSDLQYTRSNHSTLTSDMPSMSSTLMTTESRSGENEVSTTSFPGNPPVMTSRKEETSSSSTLTSGIKLMKRKLNTHENASIPSSSDNGYLPKINSYTSVDRLPFTAKLKKKTDNDFSIDRRRMVTDSQSLASESTISNRFQSVDKMDETNLFLQLLKTKLDKLSAKSKLNCQNEMLQCVLKYELKLVDLATEPQSND